MLQKELRIRRALSCIFAIGAFLTFQPPAATSATNDQYEGSIPSFPALGASHPVQVEVPWNRYYDSDGLGAILKRLHHAFPSLTKLYSIGKSYEGREIWCLERSGPVGPEANRKPAMFIDGNIHGNEVQGAEVVVDELLAHIR